MLELALELRLLGLLEWNECILPCKNAMKFGGPGAECYGSSFVLPQNSCVEVLTPNGAVFGGRVFN